ncbi:MAG: hypothetical protein WCR30_01985 [Clostridia bacterium]
MKKCVLANVILKLLLKSTIYAFDKDSEVKDELNSLPKPFVLKINILPFGPSALLKIESNKVEIVKASDRISLLVEFKNIKNAKKALLGKESLSKSFARHNLLVKGDISNAMAIVRIINKIECYLFPRFITKKINLPKIKKQFCSLKLYLFLLFGKTKRSKE